MIPAGVMAQGDTGPTLDPSLCSPLHVMWADDPAWSNPGDGNAVTTWRNGGSVGGNPTQGTASLRPIFRASEARLNNRAAVDFDGTDDVLSFNVTDRTQPLSLVCVCVADVATGNRQMFGNNASSVHPVLYQVNGKWAYYADTPQEASAADTDAHVHIGYFNGASSKRLVDGATISTANPGSNTFQELNIGNSGTGSRAWDGPIAFAAVYAGDVTAHASYAALVAALTTDYGL